MEIILGKTAGFCYGVKNAVEKTIEILEENNKKDKIYCLGELVHNKQVVEKIEKLGINVIENVEELPKTDNKNDKVIIRAHGVAKDVYDKLTELNYEIKDLTCPNVLNIHNIVKKYIEDDYYIILIGQKNHPEVLGTYGWCSGKCLIIENNEDIDKNIDKFMNIKKILVVAQTTYSLEKFNDIVNDLKEKLSNKDIEIRNTICNATKIRQEETEKIAQDVDLMIIIGGKNSSNTRKLYDISIKHTKAVCIETVSELNLKELEGCKKIGIMAGASTPKTSIDEVIEKIKNL